MAATWTGASWAATTAYALGARAVNGGNAYRCVVAGTSAGAGGPSGTGSAIVDGSVTWAYLGAFTGAVLDVAANLGDTPAGAQATLLTLAEQLCNSDAWGTLRDDGVRYLAAHFGELARLRGSGMITAESLGQASRSYATPQGLQGSLGMSTYGAEYRRLSRLLPTALGFVP